MAVDWSELPPELLDSIAGKLTILIDYIRFRSVCLNWRSSTPRTPHNLPCQLPWLMIPQSRTNQTHRRAFFDLSGNKFHLLNLPEASHRRRLCGSSHGWLVVIEEESPAVFLLNPLTRSRIHLPPLSAFPIVVDFNFCNVGREYTLRSPNGNFYSCNLRDMRDSFVKKVILSSSPSDDGDFVALAILNQSDEIAFCRRGEQCWKFIQNTQYYCEDVIYHDGLFYAVNKYGGIAVIDVHGESPRVSIIDTDRIMGGDMQYLVCANDGFLLVTRYIDTGYDDYILDIVYTTTEFLVYRLDLNGPKWEKVTDLIDNMLFLGENSSLALSDSDFPGCKGNCIYYTDDYSESNYDGDHGNHDLGVYYLEDGRIERLPCYPRMSYSWLGRPPPIWVTPNPC